MRSKLVGIRGDFKLTNVTVIDI